MSRTTADFRCAYRGIRRLCPANGRKSSNLNYPVRGEFSIFKHMLPNRRNIIEVPTNIVLPNTVERESSGHAKNDETP